jgi:hypothetical protein
MNNILEAMIAAKAVADAEFARCAIVLAKIKEDEQSTSQDDEDFSKMLNQAAAASISLGSAITSLVK